MTPPEELRGVRSVFRFSRSKAALNCDITPIRSGTSSRSRYTAVAIRTKTLMPLDGWGSMNVTYFGLGSAEKMRSSRIGSGMTGPSSPSSRAWWRQEYSDGKITAETSTTALRSLMLSLTFGSLWPKLCR
jgi:hypothetical protein